MKLFTTALATLLFSAQFCFAAIAGTYMGQAEYTNTHGDNGVCSITLDLSNSANSFIYKLEITCANDTFAQTNVYDIQDTDLVYDGEKVGTLTPSHIMAENVKLDGDLYTFHINLNQDATINFKDNYCYEGDSADCEQFNGNFKPTTLKLVNKFSHGKTSRH